MIKVIVIFYYVYYIKYIIIYIINIILQENVILEADTVFLLMKKGFPISRNVRAQWMLEHLDTIISIQCSSFKTKEAAELETVSVLPKNKPESWSSETSHQYLYKVTSTTSIIFLAHKYRMVFNLDLSPSLATVVSNFKFNKIIKTKDFFLSTIVNYDMELMRNEIMEM